MTARRLQRHLALLLLTSAACRYAVADCVKRPSASLGKPRKEPITVPVPVLLSHALHRVTPLFPAEALAAKVDGEVIIALEVDHAGKVTKTLPLTGDPLLRPAAETAVRQWEFESFCIRGVPYTVRSVLDFQFRWRGDTLLGDRVR